jgi:hypothetical protein
VAVGELADLVVEQRQLVVAEGARGERQASSLLDQRLADLRVAVALVDGGIGRKAVQVARAVHVPDPDALAARQHHVERVVVVGPQLVLQVDQLLGGGIRVRHRSLPREALA